MVTIIGIEPGSLAQKHKIRAGDKIISINNNEIRDVLDYRFYCTDRKLVIILETADGKNRKVKIRKDEYEDIGLEFETYLMDKQRSCMNKCVFCFIDQMPKGMRESLYFKDDDSRLSFLFGNYITLTNIGDDEIDRIIKMHISPINISVHTTNPELRCKMMNNRFAGEKLKYLKRLSDAGIKINAQLVLCPGLNDGKELERSLNDLAQLYPSIESVAAVPVGLTKFREGLYPLRPFTKQEAAAVIDTIEKIGDRFYNEYNDRVFYPSDEFFALAERELPDEAYYGAFLQLENGVGMSSLFLAEFTRALEDCHAEPKYSKMTIATGKGAYGLLNKAVLLAKKRWSDLDITVTAVENEYFGPLITTTGLITGTDLIKHINSLDDPGTVLIPSAMLRRERDIFLDDYSIEDIEKLTGRKIFVTECDGASTLQAFLQ